ncbi:MAG: DUF5697 family protein [Smithellaceae bacterium]|nr:DUF5697 family protein [Smithellaceae bacterium]
MTEAIDYVEELKKHMRSMRVIEKAQGIKLLRLCLVFSEHAERIMEYWVGQRQYYEPKASGPRYLSVAPFFMAELNRIECFWVYLYYLECEQKSVQYVGINDFDGVDFIYRDKMVRVIYMSEYDALMRNRVMREHSEREEYIWLVSNLETTRKIKPITDEDMFCILTRREDLSEPDVDIYEYAEEEAET